MNFDTPPMASSRSRSSSSSSNSSFDDDYFFKTYVPLSNLPTPPLSSHSNDTSRQTTPECLFPPGEHLDPELLGPAIHLTNLIPSSTSLTTPSVPLVHAILTRASLPLETIALAVCILDSLNSRFALSWRQSCPLNTPLLTSSTSFQQPHVDSIHPELLILSALIIAVKFVDDDQEKTITYSLDWGKGMWSCEQINYSQRSILENLNYKLLPLWRDSVILGALEDMERARRQAEQPRMQYPAEPGIWDSDWETETCFGSFDRRKMSDGKAVMGVGEQLTPVETPLEENIRGTRDVLPETRKAFEGLLGRREEGTFVLPDRTLEPFPRYVDPVVEGLGF